MSRSPVLEVGCRMTAWFAGHGTMWCHRRGGTTCARTTQRAALQVRRSDKDMLTNVVEADAPTALAREEGQQAPRHAVEVDPGAETIQPDTIAGRERALRHILRGSTVDPFLLLLRPLPRPKAATDVTFNLPLDLVQFGRSDGVRVPFPLLLKTAVLKSNLGTGSSVGRPDAGRKIRRRA